LLRRSKIAVAKLDDVLSEAGDVSDETGCNLMSVASINDPKHWLGRAKEARALAEQLDDPEAKRTMLATADDYERLAKRESLRGVARALAARGVPTARGGSWTPVQVSAILQRAS
jgi:hypothetical protein